MLEKFIKKDRNEELEKILEEKNIEEQAKNLLQGILYKVEVSYKDYKKAKVTGTSEAEYVEEILRNIQKRCNQIKIVKLSEKLEDEEIQKELEKNKFYIGEKEILSYPIEEKILYAIEKKSNNKKIVNNKYGIVTVPLSNLINTGKNIDRVEPLRDFNGWSWTTIKTEVENIRANLIYQSLRMILGEEFLNSWCQDTDGIIDYIIIMREQLTTKYGEILAEQIEENLFKIAIINEIEENPKYKSEIIEQLEGINQQIKKYENTQEYIQDFTDRKKKATKEIKEIEKILSQESKLKQEYEKRNANVPIQQKIFSIKVLKQQLTDRKQQLLNEIEECNYNLNPMNYVNEKNNAKNKKEFFEIINFNEKQKENLMIDFVKSILNCFEVMIPKIEEPEKITELIYMLRYFMLLPFNKTESIKDVQQLQENIIRAEQKLIQVAVEKKVITKVPIEIMKHVFETRIILLEELYYKVTQEFEKYYVQIFDENISEEKFEIIPTEKIKTNRKIKIFI